MPLGAYCRGSICLPPGAKTAPTFQPYPRSREANTCAASQETSCVMWNPKLHYLLGQNAVRSVENEPMFRNNMSSPPSGLKNNRRNKSVWSRRQAWFWFLVLLPFRPWRCKWYIPVKHRLTFNRLRSIFQKTKLFLSTALRTSDSIYVHCHVHKSRPLIRILSQINPVHILISHFFKIRFNIILCCLNG